MSSLDLKTDKILADVRDGVGWITINNPERRNAMSLDMWAAITDAIGAFAADDAVRCAVMTGAGDKAFASGADISQFDKVRATPEAAEEYARISAGARVALLGFEKPLIGMIRGFCMGGGLAIAMTNDIRVATEESIFGIPAGRLGIAYAEESLKLLVDLVGPSRAKEILITAKRYSAREALDMGLINQVVADGDLEAAVADMTSRIRENAPLSMRANKLTVNELTKDASGRTPGLPAQLSQECFGSADYAEGRTAFMEKRKPVFQGR